MFSAELEPSIRCSICKTIVSRNGRGPSGCRLACKAAFAARVFLASRAAFLQTFFDVRNGNLSKGKPPEPSPATEALLVTWEAVPEKYWLAQRLECRLAGMGFPEKRPAGPNGHGGRKEMLLDHFDAHSRLGRVCPLPEEQERRGKGRTAVLVPHRASNAAEPRRSRGELDKGSRNPDPLYVYYAGLCISPPWVSNGRWVKCSIAE